MDEAEDVFPEKSTKRLRLRTSSINSQSSLGSHTTKSRLRPPSQRDWPSSSTLTPEIIAPIPRRHPDLASPAWARTPSPSSSREISPANSTSTRTGHRRPRPMSLGSAMELEARHGITRETENGPGQGHEREREDVGLGKRWVRWMHSLGMRRWVVLSALLASACVRWATGLGSYSGHGTPPMFGDYEAQRHWMELTIHLPTQLWYKYDLQYWGLDYPPLTAYVSWLCGVIGSRIDPSWFALDESRGIESPSSKIYMRATVFALDYVVYIPALYFFSRTWHATRSKRTQNLAFLVLLLQPALILIDNGHFQYNSVMLGFAILAINCFISGHDLLGAAFFVLSLGFKQMALYYAPAVGSYLIGKCLHLGPKEGTKLFVRLGVVTVASFVALFLPFLPPFSPLSAIMDPITRIFPFNRGIFEDKVANFWCASNVLMKWKFKASAATLVRISTLLTALGFAPAVVAAIASWMRLGTPSQSQPQISAVVTDEDKEKDAKAKMDTAVAVPATLQPVLLHALLTSAMSFFLFSFQVHEKTILVPLMPLTLLMSTAPQDSTGFKIGALANNVGVFSMWPLLKRDGLAVPYIALTLLWNRLVGHNPFRIRQSTLFDFFMAAVYLGCITLHVLEILFSPPKRYPDLYPVLNVLLSTPIFVLTWLWSIKSLLESYWVIGPLGFGESSSHHPPATDSRAPSEIGTPVTETGSAKGSSVVGSIGRERGLRARSLGYSSAMAKGSKRLSKAGSVDEVPE